LGQARDHFDNFVEYDRLYCRCEKFAQEIAAGTGPREAYGIAGYEPDRANHNRLLRRADMAARIQELKEEREFTARGRYHAGAGRSGNSEKFRHRAFD